jgi:1,2-phenylacetyl-CoA epoxidase catalytic subunit
MSTETSRIPKPFHAAVTKWRDTFIPDYDFLIDNWDKYFPKDPRFELCAYREAGMCSTIECGDHTGKAKYKRAGEMPDEPAHTLLGAIRAQASTEFGSIQQHRLTLARAQDEEEQVWILRMMAEELRHGYQMLHVLVDDPDWSAMAGQSGADMIEEILSMQTGSHLLGAFNIDFDSFVDNVVFCALIDRVGKYQLAMQKISSYQPMAESMPQMLREEAFHLAAGVVPMRRWAAKAAQGDVSITMQMLQKAINKWLPRGLEMFGDERGGASNVRAGLKPMKNAEAQTAYYEEVRKVLHDVNHRYVRARLPELDHAAAEALIQTVSRERSAVQGIAYEDLLHIPHADFYRRRGVPAFRMVGADGTVFTELASYLRHLTQALPESYLAGRDCKDYFTALQQVVAGTLTADAASKQMPALRRVGGSCPCSKSVRWVVEDPRPETVAALSPA